MPLRIMRILRILWFLISRRFIESRSLLIVIEIYGLLIIEEIQEM